jgi:hypothetical protein
VPGIRESDLVDLRWARPGYNPENPFEQSDGRDYKPAEQLVVALETGDWLEFEGSGLTPARVLEASGRDAPVAVERTARGIRVTALSPTAVHRILPASRDLVGSGE